MFSYTAGLIDEGKEVEELHSDLRAAEEECEALPKELQEIKTALDKETAELQRQESGEHLHFSPMKLGILHPTGPMVFVQIQKFEAKLSILDIDDDHCCSSGGQGVLAGRQASFFEASSGSVSCTLGSTLSQRFVSQGNYCAWSIFTTTRR